MGAFHKKKIGLDIKSRRKFLRLTQSQLAKILGVTPSAICKWELSQNKITAEMYQKIMSFKMKDIGNV